MDLHLVRVTKQDPFGHHFSLVVSANRDELEVLSNLWFVFNSVNTSRTRVDKVLDSRSDCAVRELLGGQDVDFPRERGIHFNTRIISDVGQMDDGLNSVEGDCIGISHVRLDYVQIDVVSEVVAEPFGVYYRDLVPVAEQLACEY